MPASIKAPVVTRRTLLTLPLLLSACSHTPPLPEGQHPLELALPGGGSARLWLYLPTGYHAAPQAWPLVVFLHGSGERGSQLDAVKVHGPPKHVAAGLALPFVLASPQLDGDPDGDTRWEPAQLHALLQVLQARLHVDPARCSATGLSLGGHGVWDWAAAYPEDLAAIAPVCGHGDPAAVCRARRVPVRAYHGDGDSVVPLARQQACIDALRACGGQAEFIVYPGVGHDAWNPAYTDPALVPWLMRQARR